MDLTPFKECAAHKQWLFISNETKSYRPCCWFYSNISADTHDEYQEKLSKLDIEKNCGVCIKTERDGGKWSPRTHFNDSLLGQPKTYVMTISLDNLCNLKCVTCSPSNSSMIAVEMDDYDEPDFNGRVKKDYIKIQKQAPKKVEFIKDTLKKVMPNYDYLRIEFLGGEPLINPATFELIDWIKDQPYSNNTSVCITTNTTTYSEKIMGYKDVFQQLAFQFSVDGIEDTFEYLRFNTVWGESKANMDRYFAEHSHWITFNYTLSWMNSLHFVDFLNMVIQNYPNVSYMLVTKLIGPKSYSVNVLPLSIRQKIVEEVEKKLLKTDSKPLMDAFDLYKQHMLSGAQEVMNNVDYIYGLKAMHNNDKKRGRDYKQVLAPVMKLIYENSSESTKQKIDAELKFQYGL